MPKQIKCLEYKHNITCLEYVVEENVILKQDANFVLF